MDKEIYNVIADIQSLRASWKKPLTQIETVALYNNHETFREYPFALVKEWLDSRPKYPPYNRLRFLETAGSTEVGRATDWKNESDKTKTDLDEWKA